MKRLLGISLLLAIATPAVAADNFQIRDTFGNVKTICAEETAGVLTICSTATIAGDVGGTASDFGAAFPTPGTAAGMKSGANMVPLVSTDGTSLDVNVVSGASAGSDFGAAVPALGPAVGFSDGTNLQMGRVFDYDSGAGSQYLIGVGPRISASGGSVAVTSQAAGADNVSNTYNAYINASFGYVFDGSTWDRWTGAVTQGGTWTVQPGDTANTTPWKMDDDATQTLVTSTNTKLDTVNTNLVANTAAITAGSIPTADTLSFLSVNNTTGVSIKASAGVLMHVDCYATPSATVVAYLKFYDTASAPTCGSGTPKRRVMIPINTTGGSGTSIMTGGVAGSAFGTGIGYCLTTGIGNSDTTAPAANAYVCNVDYK